MATMKKDKDVNRRSCAFCGVKEGSNNQLKNCSRCKLVAYCGRECQAAHWKNGHKAICIAVKDRKPSSNTETPPAASFENEMLPIDNCVICLGKIKVSDSCKLPCGHIFHRSCVSDLRSQAPSLVCPLCRKDLPPGPEQAYTKALGILYSIKKVAISSSDERTASVEMIRLFTCAAEEGHAPAQHLLGSLFREGDYGVDKNIKKSFHWWLQAADLGHANAQCDLGNMYCNGEGVEKNHKKAVQYYLKAIDQGHADAQYNLGNMYCHGVGVEENNKKAVQYYSKAADQGHARAQFNLGVMYHDGEGIEKNIKKSFQYYLKAADQGHADAQCNLGAIYRHTGEGAEKNLKKAFQYYMKAADQDNTEAQHNLGSMYYIGEGVEKNLKKSFQYYSKAADQGYANAQYNLGCMYYNGEGVEVNDEKAKQWLLKAAKQGNVSSQTMLQLAFGIN